MSATRQRRRTDWCELVSEQARSGQGVTAFCRELGIGTSSFYGWKKRLGVVDASKAAVPTEGTSTAGQKASSEPPVRFLEVKMAATEEPIKLSLTPAPMIEVRLPHGRSLMVAPDFDAIHLQRLLAVLSAEIPVDKSLSVAWQAAS